MLRYVNVSLLLCVRTSSYVQRFNLMWFTCYIGWWLKAGTQQIASRKPLVKLKIWTRRILALVCAIACDPCEVWTNESWQHRNIWLRLQTITNTIACAMSSSWASSSRCRLFDVVVFDTRVLEWGERIISNEETEKITSFRSFSKRFLQTERCLRYEWRHFYWPLRCVAFFLRVYCVFKEESKNLELKKEIFLSVCL